MARRRALVVIEYARENGRPLDPAIIEEAIENKYEQSVRVEVLEDESA